MRSCVTPAGFRYLLHRPSFKVLNRRETWKQYHLGVNEDGCEVISEANFPQGHLDIPEATPIYEIPNPFPFWGATYILGDSAERNGERFEFRFTPERDEQSQRFEAYLLEGIREGRLSWDDIPRHVKLTVAQNSRNGELLSLLARWVAEMELDEDGIPRGLRYLSRGAERAPAPIKRDKDIYETVANNPALPKEYRRVMVLNPGAQGSSPIVGEFRSGDTHVWEYLRANSYVPWGHFASNMAEDSIRYSGFHLTWDDMHGLRHLYYQRIFSQMALLLGLLPDHKGPNLSPLDGEELEELRLKVLEAIQSRLSHGSPLPFQGTLWGWNYGYDISGSGYRLHASHQQIHNQYALVPSNELTGDGPTPFMIGRMVADFCASFRRRYGEPFFQCYLRAIGNNRRLDGREDRPSSLVAHQEDGVVIMIPKAQRSQGEVQVMVTQEMGNIVETTPDIRNALDRCLLMALKGLIRLGAEMVTFCEVSRPLDVEDRDIRLFYYLLPRHTRSPGSFSERQQRWITGHFPEDFAEALRNAIAD